MAALSQSGAVPAQHCPKRLSPLGRLLTDEAAPSKSIVKLCLKPRWRVYLCPSSSGHMTWAQGPSLRD